MSVKSQYLTGYLYDDKSEPVSLMRDRVRGRVELSEEVGHNEHVFVVVEGPISEHVLQAVEKWVWSARRDNMVKQIAEEIEKDCLTQTLVEKNNSRGGLTLRSGLTIFQS